MEYLSRKIDGIEITYLDEGEGFPLFFIPPWGSSSIAFDGITKLMKDDGIRVIRANLPGWGSKSKQLLKVKDFDSYVLFISKFINSFEFKDYGVAGYSLGVTFILHAISMGYINPSKNIVVSGFHSRKNIFETKSRLSLNASVYDGFRKLRIPLAILRFNIKLIYALELLTSRLYLSKARYYINLIFLDAMNGDVESSMTPVFTLKDLDQKGLNNFKGESLVIYNANEPWYFKQFTQEIADMLHVKPVIINALNHRHLSFEPEKSYNVIKEFINTK
ncbi:alpha/beta hydrolase [Candidatus Dojkabacteria bacterium]|nr:alpha/beta hydrolase [Candidatus Dojkabacteria bacterium]